MLLRPWIVSLLLITACRASPYSAVSDEELHARARSLPLTERYQLYLDVLHSRTPNRPILAEDVAALGAPAWEYVLGQALSEDSAGLSRALPVLYAFQRRCSPAELEELRARADRGFSADTATAFKSSIDDLCGAGLPAGD
jgi:hypothetical protein